MTHDLYERCNLAQAVTVVVTMPPKGGRKRVFAHGVSNEVSTKFAAASTKACRTENQVPQLKSSERQDSDTGMFRQAPWIDMWSDCAHDMFSDAPSTSMAIRRPNMLVTAFKRHLQSSSDIVTLTRKLLSKFERFVWGRNTYILAQYSDENGYTEVVYSTSVTTEQFTEAVLRTRAELNEIRIDGFFLRNLTSEINQYEAQVASVITTTDWRFMKQGYGFDILLGTTRPGLAFCINASTLDISIATRQQVDAIGGSSVVIGRTTLGLTDGFTRLQFPHVAPNASSPWMVFIRRCFPLLDTRMRVQYVLRRAQVRRHLCEGMFLIVSYTSSGKTSFVKCVAKIIGEMETVNIRSIIDNDKDAIEKICRTAFVSIQDIPERTLGEESLPMSLDSSTLQEFLRNDPLASAPKYKKDTTMIPNATCIATTNQALGSQDAQLYARVEVWPFVRSFATTDSIRDPNFVENMINGHSNAAMRWLWSEDINPDNYWKFAKKPLSSLLAVDITGEGMRRYTLDFERHIAITNSANDAVSVRLAWAAVNPSITYPASMESSLRGAIGYTTGQSGLIYAIGYKFRV